MITNERQYRVTKAILARLRAAVASFDLPHVAKAVGSDLLARAELDALKSESENLANQLSQYDALRSGAIRILSADSIEELPGLLVRARIARGYSQRDLAELLGIREQQVQRYESENYASASLRRLQEIAAALQLKIREVGQLEQSVPASRTAGTLPVNWSAFPIKEMYRRGWFEFQGFTGSMSSALANGEDLVMEFVNSAMPQREPALLKHRARAGSEMDIYSLWAWQCRVLISASAVLTARTFRREVISDEWLRSLVKLSRFDNGPRQAVEFLAEAGIPLVVVPHLPKTFLDGAAFLLPGGRPVVGMTLRYDRLDNFWFVLLHELAHVMYHLKKGKVEDIFDDLDSEPDELEEEANRIAGNLLIADAEWEIAMPRFLRTENSVVEFAAKREIHAAIVAGRIRNEANNFTILSRLVGSGQVRVQFPDIPFAQ